jgi:hypothetical protein
MHPNPSDHIYHTPYVSFHLIGHRMLLKLQQTLLLALPLVRRSVSLIG